jgi:copper oxidase (laccase) domain-containing protein
MQLNLQGVVVDKLINMNIQKENIIDVNECTCCSDKYYSYRRQGNLTGRMISMIGWQTDHRKIINNS